MTRYLAVTMILACVACGDFVGDAGELGRVIYTMHADYELSGSLSENRIVTGHPQDIFVSLTKKGSKVARNPGQITHRIVPGGSGTNVDVDTVDLEGEFAPGLEITVDEGGSYVLESVYNGEVLDFIDLQFAPPDSYETITWIRPPGDDQFHASTASDVVEVEEGTQIAMVSIPRKGNDRLLGDADLDVTFEPDWAAVSVHNVYDVYEDEGVLGGTVSESLVFINPATVTVTITDLMNNVSSDQTYEVTAIAQTTQ